MGMGVTVRKYWERVRGSLWFLPGLMALGAAGMAALTVWFDGRVPAEWVRGLGWVYNGGAEGASAVLGTVASSMMTITGLVFSLTLVALSQASTQFGPRLLRNFMRDTANQMVLGTFVATFLYCLLVLRTIRRADERLFVPHLSVTLGVAFALVSLGVLIYFIHHVAVSIQADEIIARVSGELERGIERMYPVKIGEGEEAGAMERPRGEGKGILSEEEGYVELIDGEALMQAAEAGEVVIEVGKRPGHYVSKGTVLARGWPAERVGEKVCAGVRGAYAVGASRSPAQDVEFTLLQLVEVAVRALSPGINDPFTAMTCVDRLGSALAGLAGRERPEAYRRGEGGKLRVIAEATRFERLLAAGFDQIRQASRGNVAVTLRVLEALEVVAGGVGRAEDFQAVARQAGMVVAGAREAVKEAGDLRAVEERYGRVVGETRN
jgi:uncharacterized membrane protein